jgi:hypothetical protein
VGITGLALAGFGLWYSAITFYGYQTGLFSGITAQADAPYFEEAFLIMWSISIACLLGVVFCSVQFIRLSLNWLWLLVAIGIVEVLYIPIVGRLWLSREYGMSIGAASGVSSGGLMPQLITLFPIWAPISIWFARRSLAAR